METLAEYWTLPPSKQKDLRRKADIIWPQPGQTIFEVNGTVLVTRGPGEYQETIDIKVSEFVAAVDEEEAKEKAFDKAIYKAFSKAGVGQISEDFKWLDCTVEEDGE